MTIMTETDRQTRPACSRWAALVLAVCTHPLNTRLLAQCIALIPAASLCPPFSQMTIHNTRVSTPLVGGRCAFVLAPLVTDYVICCSQEMAIFSISPVTPISVLQRYATNFTVIRAVRMAPIFTVMRPASAKTTPRINFLYKKTKQFTAF